MTDWIQNPFVHGHPPPYGRHPRRGPHPGWGDGPDYDDGIDHSAGAGWPCGDEAESEVDDEEATDAESDTTDDEDGSDQSDYPVCRTDPSDLLNYDDEESGAASGPKKPEQDPENKPPKQTGWNEDEWRWVEPDKPDDRGKWVPVEGTPHHNPHGTGSNPQITYDPDPQGRHEGPHWDVDDGKKGRRRFRPDGTEIDLRGDPIATPDRVKPPSWLPSWQSLSSSQKVAVVIQSVAVTALVVTPIAIRLAVAVPK